MKAVVEKYKSTYSKTYYPAVGFQGIGGRKAQAAVYEVAAMLERGSISKQWAIVASQGFIYIELATDDRIEYDEACGLVDRVVCSYNELVAG